MGEEKKQEGNAGKATAGLVKALAALVNRIKDHLLTSFLLAVDIVLVLGTIWIASDAYLMVLRISVPLSLVLACFVFIMERRWAGQRSSNTIQVAQQLDEGRAKQVHNLMSQAVGVARTKLGEGNPDLVRANLFGLDGTGMLRMVPHFMVNMSYPPEHTISMPPGYGSSGRAFKEGLKNVAILRKDWGKDRIEDDELKKVHKDLRWITSVPVFSQTMPKQVVWVLNVDGLKTGHDQDILDDLSDDLLYVSDLITKAVWPQAVPTNAP